MALIERVTTLLRANIKELIDRAENPETSLKQVVLDMENQLLQVKTQVAIALADRHLLEKKALDGQELAADWHRKAELAVKEGDDALARIALRRALTCEGNLTALRAQIAYGTAEAETLRTSYTQLQIKLEATRSQCERLIAQHRRARMLANLADAQLQNGQNGQSRAPGPQQFSRMRESLDTAEDAVSQAQGAPLPSENTEPRFGELERADHVEKLLSDLKSKQRSLLSTR